MFGPGVHAGCNDLIFDEIVVRRRGYYAGQSANNYVISMRCRGGIYLERDGEVRVFIPAPVRRGKGLLLPFPVIAQEDENLGLQCLGHLVQLVNAITETRTVGPLINPYIIFPDDNLPSTKLVRLLGLCDPMPDRAAVTGPSGLSDNRRFYVSPDMFPGVFGALMNRNPTWIGAAAISTRGNAGTASVKIAPIQSPFSLARLPLFTALAAGRLSVIGLPDIRTSRFGG
jgi:hypothetical protein